MISLPGSLCGAVSTSSGSKTGPFARTDLIVIDGGLGQVNAVQGVLEELGVDIP